MSASSASSSGLSPCVTLGSLPPLGTLAPELLASVVIPARNASATLSLALTGLQAQAAPPSFEVLVVDDGSSDGTVAVAQSFDGLPLRILSTTGGVGPGAARNLGAREA